MDALEQCVLAIGRQDERVETGESIFVRVAKRDAVFNPRLVLRLRFDLDSEIVKGLKNILESLKTVHHKTDEDKEIQEIKALIEKHK